MLKSFVLNKSKKVTRLASTLLLVKSSLQNQALLRQIEIMINKALMSQPAAYDHLLKLDGKSFNIAMSGLGLSWNISIVGQNFILSSGAHEFTDCNIKILSQQIPTAFLKGNQNTFIKVEGDYVSALHLQGAFQRLEFSLYPFLIETIGQIPATFIMNMVEQISFAITSAQNKVSLYIQKI